MTGEKDLSLSWGKRWFSSYFFTQLIWRVEIDLFFLLMFNNLNELCGQVEMTGDFTPDLMALLSADIIISTPEKWDGISRNWHTRSYVKKVIPLTFLAWFHVVNISLFLLSSLSE